MNDGVTAVSARCTEFAFCLTSAKGSGNAVGGDLWFSGRVRFLALLVQLQ